MVVVPVSLNGLCCSSEVPESLPLLAFRRDVVNVIFLKYSKEGRSSTNSIISGHLKFETSHPSDFCYNEIKHYELPVEKQGKFKVCKKNS